MAIQDPAMGFVPKTHPKFYQIVKVAADGAAVARFAAVSIVGGYAVASDVTPSGEGGVAGIAMHHVAATPGVVTDLIICNDPDVIYEVTGDTTAVITDVGGWVLLKAVTVSTNGQLSTATVDLPALATPTAETPFQVTGLSQTVDGAATKALVKLVRGTFHYFDIEPTA